MSSQDVESRIEAFVREQFAVSPDDASFTRTTDLFDSGYVDSVGVVELLEFLRGDIGVDIPEGDLLSEDFSSIDGIATIIRRLDRPDSLHGPARQT